MRRFIAILAVLLLLADYSPYLGYCFSFGPGLYQLHANAL